MTFDEKKREVESFDRLVVRKKSNESRSKRPTISC